MRKTTKGVVAIGAGLAVVVSAGIAYAYYNTTISGTTATAGATVSSTGASALTTSLKAGGAATNLVPGGSSKSLVVTVTNPNAYSVQLSPAKSLHLDFANMSSGDTACTPVAGPNTIALLSAADVAAPSTVIAGGGTVDVTFTVSMADSATVDQTPCIAKSFTIPVTVV